MATATRVKMDDETKHALQSATFVAGVLKLRDQLMDRVAYLRVAHVLGLLGGRWNRKAQGFVFKDRDAAQQIEKIIAAGSVTDKTKLFQFYLTPPALAERLVRMAQVRKTHTVLEPSAGDGAILSALPADVWVNGTVHAYEIQPELADGLAKKFADLRLMTGDFLYHATTLLHEFVYDRIIANPPFSNHQGETHAAHMLDLLKPGGRLVCVLPAVITSSVSRTAIELRSKLNWECSAWETHPLEKDAFAEAGTRVSTLVLVANKKKTVMKKGGWCG